MSPDGAIAEVLERLARREGGRLTAALLRLLGPRRLALAEDCVQDAFLAALGSWPATGVPEAPVAWLLAVARNRARDRIRRNAFAAAIAPDALELIAGLGAAAPSGPLPDDELGLIAMCCHPALAPEIRIALTLQSVCGFKTEEIARAFLATPEALAQRLLRAKTRLRSAPLDLAMPAGPALRPRLPAMLRTVYLLFNEGYAATAGDRLIRTDMCAEALRLAEMLAGHALTACPEASALAALLAFQHARAAARLDADGRLVLLPAQDRTRWDRALIARGFRHLRAAQAGTHLTALHLEAGIASVHAAAPRWEATDWGALVGYYDTLMAIAPSPVAAVNRAIALGERDGPDAGRAALARLGDDRAVRRYRPYWLGLAAFAGAAGDRAAARAALAMADSLPASAPERAHAAARAAVLAEA